CGITSASNARCAAYDNVPRAVGAHGCRCPYSPKKNRPHTILFSLNKIINTNWQLSGTRLSSTPRKGSSPPVSRLLPLARHFQPIALEHWCAALSLCGILPHLGVS